MVTHLIREDLGWADLVFDFTADSFDGFGSQRSLFGHSLSSPEKHLVLYHVDVRGTQIRVYGVSARLGDPTWVVLFEDVDGWRFGSIFGSKSIGGTRTPAVLKNINMLFPFLGSLLTKRHRSEVNENFLKFYAVAGFHTIRNVFEDFSVWDSTIRELPGYADEYIKKWWRAVYLMSCGFGEYGSYSMIADKEWVKVQTVEPWLREGFWTHHVAGFLESGMIMVNPAIRLREYGFGIRDLLDWEYSIIPAVNTPGLTGQFFEAGWTPDGVNLLARTVVDEDDGYSVSVPALIFEADRWGKYFSGADASRLLTAGYSLEETVGLFDKGTPVDNFTLSFTESFAEKETHHRTDLVLDYDDAKIVERNPKTVWLLPNPHPKYRIE